MGKQVQQAAGGTESPGVFVGTYEHALDAKKRFSIPSVWREVAGEPRLLVLPGVNVKCLCVYPARELPRRLERLRNLSIADRQGRQFARSLASRADQVTWDAQGRIRIQDELMAEAGLTDRVVLAGTFDGFELWSPKEWKRQRAVLDQSGLEKAARYVGF